MKKMNSVRKKSKNPDMTAGSPAKLLTQFAIPLILGNLFQQMYNTVDSLIVGNFVGTGALAAVGATTGIVNILIKFFNGVSIGAGVVISQFYGGHDHENVQRAVKTTMSLTFYCSVLFTAGGYMMSPLMLRLMSTPADISGYAVLYLRIYFIGISGLLIYNMGSGILRATGDTKRPLVFLCFSSILNTALDLIFVLLFRWGIAGAAFATIIAQFFSAFLILRILTGNRENFKLQWRKLSVEKNILRQILMVGLPTGIQQSLTAFSNVCVYTYINSFGSACMAAWSCYTKIDQFVFLPMQSMGNAATTFVGQNVGAGKMKRAQKGTEAALVMSLLATVFICASLWLCAPFLVALFNREKAVLRYGVLFLRVNLIFMPFCCFNQVLAGALRGIGKAGVPMFLLLFSQVFCRQFYLFTATRIISQNAGVVCFAFPFSWILCAVFITVYYNKEFCRQDAPPAAGR